VAARPRLPRRDAPLCQSHTNGKLKEYQQKNSPGATAGTKKKRKTKEGSRPETPTNDDRQPPENVRKPGIWGEAIN
uniref:Uncharacterized protein n=1 Tax=Bubo bubo TaxID=30461 RepID=A0A8C0FN11_BUBBB